MHFSDSLHVCVSFCVGFCTDCEPFTSLKSWSFWKGFVELLVAMAMAASGSGGNDARSQVIIWRCIVWQALVQVVSCSITSLHSGRWPTMGQGLVFDVFQTLFQRGASRSHEACMYNPLQDGGKKGGPDWCWKLCSMPSLILSASCLRVLFCEDGSWKQAKHLRGHLLNILCLCACVTWFVYFQMLGESCILKHPLFIPSCRWHLQAWFVGFETYLE